MRILVLGINYAPEEIGIAIYTQGMCEALTRMGHSVRIVAAKPYYPQWKLREGFGSWWNTAVENGVSITRCPLYVPAAPTGIGRILHHISFAISASIPMLWAAQRWRPDIVFTVAPSLVAAPVARLAARLAGAPSWLHIQDFEVEASYATGLIKETSRIVRYARSMERRIIRSFDRLSSISPEMCRKLREFGLASEQVFEFRNWADLDAVVPTTEPSPYRALWNIKARHVALYSGNIANKQGIDIVLEAARILEHRTDLHFVVCGQGPNRQALEQRAAGLSNIEFHDLQPVERLSDLLNLATIHLLPQKANAADLVLPSKLTNMLASGRPVIVTAAPNTGLMREVEGCGIATQPENPSTFAAAIQQLIDDPALHQEMSIAARKRAELAWSRQNILAAFEAELSSRIGRKNVHIGELPVRVQEMEK